MPSGALVKPEIPSWSLGSVCDHEEEVVQLTLQATEPHVFTVASLAKRWGCSEVHVRNLINKGELRSFRLGGKLIRIPADEVARWEQSFALPESTNGSSSSGTMKPDAASAVHLARMTTPRARPALVSSSAKSVSSKPRGKT